MTELLATAVCNRLDDASTIAAQRVVDGAIVQLRNHAPSRHINISSFDNFYQQEYRAIVGFGYVVSGSWPVAEDLVQDAMMEAHRNWAKISTYDNPAGWARRVLINKHHSKMRRFASETRTLVRLSGRRAERVELQPETEQVFALVRQLPTRQAQAIALFYWDDYSTKQIATVLGCGTETVKTNLKRGRAALRKMLEQDETLSRGDRGRAESTEDLFAA